MILLTLDQLNSHDVYEFCYNMNYPNNWNENSLFFNLDDMIYLSPYIDKIFTEFHYYGPQKITISEWNCIKELCLLDREDDTNFFDTIDNWINYDPENNDFFWLLGV